MMTNDFYFSRIVYLENNIGTGECGSILICIREYEEKIIYHTTPCSSDNNTAILFLRKNIE
jgi:hypothetical protein